MSFVKIKGLPVTLRDIASKLYKYGYTIENNGDGTWIVRFPKGNPTGYGVFYEHDLSSALLSILREEEKVQGTLELFTQFDTRWGKMKYGNAADDTSMKEAGCGPTSLAIVIKYLMNNDSLKEEDELVCRADTSSTAAQTVSPIDTAKYAAKHGRVSGHGTAGDPMINGISDNWAGYSGSRVSLDYAVFLLEQGKLVIFLCKSCKGYNTAPKASDKPGVTYGGHYMVLAGVEGPSGPNQMFNVMDPGRNEKRAMHFISKKQLETNTGGFWWVYKNGEPQSMVCVPE